MSIELSYDAVIKGLDVGGKLEQFEEVNVNFLEL